MPFNPAFAESDVPIDPGAGITPAFIEACLPTETAGCHLSCMGAYNALMAFFIGAPAEPGLFYAELYKASDTFGHMETALARILAILAPEHVDPATAIKFRFPLVAFTGDPADDDATKAFVEAATSRFADKTNSGSGPSGWFLNLKSQISEIGPALADAIPPVQNMQKYKTATTAASAATTKAMKPNSSEQQRITAGELLDPVPVAAALLAYPKLAATFKDLAGNALKGLDLLGNKSTGTHDPGVADWASEAFPSSGSDADNIRDLNLIATILSRDARAPSEYEAALQPLASVFMARDAALLRELKRTVSPASGRAALTLRATSTIRHLCRDQRDLIDLLDLHTSILLAKAIISIHGTLLHCLAYSMSFRQ